MICFVVPKWLQLRKFLFKWKRGKLYKQCLGVFDSFLKNLELGIGRWGWLWPLKPPGA